jgi:hypothetical protein
VAGDNRTAAREGGEEDADKEVKKVAGGVEDVVCAYRVRDVLVSGVCDAEEEEEEEEGEEEGEEEREEEATAANAKRKEEESRAEEAEEKEEEARAAEVDSLDKGESTLGNEEKEEEEDVEAAAKRKPVARHVCVVAKGRAQEDKIRIVEQLRYDSRSISLFLLYWVS